MEKLEPNENLPVTCSKCGKQRQSNVWVETTDRERSALGPVSSTLCPECIAPQMDRLNDLHNTLENFRNDNERV